MQYVGNNSKPWGPDVKGTDFTKLLRQHLLSCYRIESDFLREAEIGGGLP